MSTGETESRAGKAHAMLAAFSSVGVHSFDVTMTDIEGRKPASRLTGPSKPCADRSGKRSEPRSSFDRITSFARAQIL